MKVLVTGGTGFIGSHIVRAAVEAGHDVRVLARTPARVPMALAPLGIALDDIVAGDATDPVAVAAAVAGCDAVIHTAAVVAMRRADAERVHGTNIRAAEVVLSAAVDAGCDPIIHVSSVAVFALTGEPITLDTPPALSDGAYARSKSESEWFARGLQRAGAPVTITYPGGVLGPYTIDLNAVHRAAQTWIAFMPLPPSGINIIDVRDLAALHVALLQTGQGPRRFLMGGRFIPWTDLIATIEDVTGRSIRRVPSPGPVMRGLGRFIDATHLPSPVDFDLTEEAMVQATEAVPIDSDATMATLGATLRPVAETMADTYRWMLERGDITEKQAGLLAPTA